MHQTNIFRGILRLCNWKGFLPLSMRRKHITFVRVQGRRLRKVIAGSVTDPNISMNMKVYNNESVLVLILTFQTCFEIKFLYTLVGTKRNVFLA